MLCIYCGHDTIVTNSRHQKRSNHVWRRRKCIKCEGVFTSNEAPDLATSLVLRTSQNGLVPFQRDHFFISLYEALRHRTTALTDANELLNTILAKTKAHQGVIERNELVATTHTVLKRFDTASFFHYSAFHPVSR